MQLKKSLFRPEAIEFQRNKHWGEVVLIQPVPAKLLFLALLLVAAIVVTFLCTVPYARKETVLGYLAPASGVVRVYAPRQGTVGSVLVQDGQRVAEGEPLLTVVVDQTSAAGANVDAAVLDALREQKALLAERIVTQERLGAAERARLQARISGIDAELALLDTQTATQQERVRIAASRASSSDALRTRGIVSDADHKLRREALLEQQRNLTALLQEMVARRNERTEITLSLATLPSSTAEKVEVLRNDLLIAEQRIAEVEGRRAYVVLAPVAGRVSTLQATAGRAADPRQPQLSILPDEGILQAELFVPTRAAGFVQPGQEVRVLYDAFPYQHFGTYKGRVVAVSRTVLMEADVAAPVQLREPAYRVIASIDRQEIQAGGRTAASLQADMLLRADIVLERRKLMAWLLDPLLRVRLS
jgi:membrane fusion protein